MPKVLPQVNLLYFFVYLALAVLFVKTYSDFMDFPGGPVVKNPPPNAGDTGFISSQGRFHMLRGN